MKGEGMDAAWRILPDDMVCACLDETGERRVRRYDHCQRCGAFMAVDDDLVLVNVEGLAAALRSGAMPPSVANLSEIIGELVFAYLKDDAHSA